MFSLEQMIFLRGIYENAYAHAEPPWGYRLHFNLSCQRLPCSLGHVKAFEFFIGVRFIMFSRYQTYNKSFCCFLAGLRGVKADEQIIKHLIIINSVWSDEDGSNSVLGFHENLAWPRLQTYIFRRFLWQCLGQLKKETYFKSQSQIGL